jgi:hypothetical protein
MRNELEKLGHVLPDNYNLKEYIVFHGKVQLILEDIDNPNLPILKLEFLKKLNAYKRTKNIKFKDEQPSTGLFAINY